MEGRISYVMSGNPGRLVRPGGKVTVVIQLRVAGEQSELDGRPHSVFTSMRDYRAEGGVMIPQQLETAVEGVPGSEKLVVERVVLNPKLDDASFGRPN